MKSIIARYDAKGRAEALSSVAFSVRQPNEKVLYVGLGSKQDRKEQKTVGPNVSGDRAPNDSGDTTRYLSPLLQYLFATHREPKLFGEGW